MHIQEQLVLDELVNDMQKLPLPILKMLSAAVKEFVRQTKESDIEKLDEPSEPSFLGIQKKRPFSALFGEWSGKVWMSDDFDEPLREMEEYM